MWKKTLGRKGIYEESSRVIGKQAHKAALNGSWWAMVSALLQEDLVYVHAVKPS